MHCPSSRTLQHLSRRSLLRGALAGVGSVALGSEPASAAATFTPIPVGYVRVGRAAQVPPAVLFAVACQESVMRFGDKALPYPWTLCVRGEPRRFTSFASTLADLESCLARGITNVDCGAMQVNWHWHCERMGSPRRALDPYPNLGLGAALLREHYEASGNDWYTAVGLYHHPTDKRRSEPYARAVFERVQRMAVAASQRTRLITEEAPHA